MERILNEEHTSRTGFRYEVITAANPGWASTHERIFINNVIVDLQPDLVIAFSGINDVHWALRGANVMWFRSYADELYRGLLNDAYTVGGFGSLVAEIPYQTEPVAPNLVSQRLLRNVHLCLASLDEGSVPFLFAFQPSRDASTSRRPGGPATSVAAQNHPSSNVFSRTQYALTCQDEIANALQRVESSRFFFEDFRDLFDDVGDLNQIFLDNYHLGDRGNDRVAGRLAVVLRQKLPWLLEPGTEVP